MSWQAEYEKKYREKLEREWTVEGYRLPVPTYDTMTQSSYSAVPRIEACGTTEPSYAVLGTDGEGCGTIYQNAYDALTEINGGKPLPIYKGGKWDRLNTHDWSQAKKDASEIGYGIDTFSYENTICPVKIWRFTR